MVDWFTIMPLPASELCSSLWLLTQVFLFEHFSFKGQPFCDSPWEVWCSFYFLICDPVVLTGVSQMGYCLYPNPLPNISICIASSLIYVEYSIFFQIHSLVNYLATACIHNTCNIKHSNTIHKEKLCLIFCLSVSVQCEMVPKVCMSERVSVSYQSTRETRETTIYLYISIKPLFRLASSSLPVLSAHLSVCPSMMSAYLTFTLHVCHSTGCLNALVVPLSLCLQCSSAVDDLSSRA